jgi:hypothetical protein
MTRGNRMKDTGIPTALVRFLDNAAALTLEEWTTIYWRYVHNPAITKAARKLVSTGTQAWLDEYKAMTAEEQAASGRVVAKINARIDAISAKLPDVVLDAARGGSLRPRVEWIISRVDTALEYPDVFKAKPACRKAIKVFLTLFDGIVDFPEYPQ